MSRVREAEAVKSLAMCLRVVVYATAMLMLLILFMAGAQL